MLDLSNGSEKAKEKKPEKDKRAEHSTFSKTSRCRAQQSKAKKKPSFRFLIGKRLLRSKSQITYLLERKLADKSTAPRKTAYPRPLYFNYVKKRLYYWKRAKRDK